MATLADRQWSPAAGDDRFFLLSAFAMAAVLVAGFSVQLAAGRSSFASPPLVHVHAVVFMGWVVLYLLQNVFVARKNRVLHRRLGWIATGWVVAMVVLGVMVTLAIVRRGHVPFFFRPQHFLVFDPVSVLSFAGLTGAAIALRRRTDWHRRLHFCAMALLLGPGFGRLLPMPLLPPLAFEATFVLLMLFPLAGVVADWRRSGSVHPAWGWAIAAMVGSMVVTEAVTYSPLGDALYASATAGSPGAAVPPLEFAARPEGGRITGRQ